MSATYNDIQLDALRELANIGAGNASTALSGMLGRPVDLTRARTPACVPMAQAVEEIGSPESEITGIALGVDGDMPVDRADAADAGRRRRRSARCSAWSRTPSTRSPRWARSATSSAPPT